MLTVHASRDYQFYLQARFLRAQAIKYNSSWDFVRENIIYPTSRIQEAPQYNLPQDFVRKHINYSFFRLKEPYFIDENDRKMFLLDQHNQNHLREPSKDMLTGIIDVIPNGTVNGGIDCGWRTDLSKFRIRPKSAKGHYSVLCPLLIPDGGAFQHFVDGVLPKLMQMRSILPFQGITYLFRRPRDQNIYAILKHMNISFAFYDSGDITADYLVNTCITPPVHPLLFSGIRKMLTNSSDNTDKTFGDGFVILLTRAHSRNSGRNMRNKDKIISYLQGRYGRRFRVFNGDLTFNDSMNLFQQARIVIGVHGGAFYNIIFAPSSLHILEIMPTTTTGKVTPRYIAHPIFWVISNMLNQTFWRINNVPLDSAGNVNVDIGKVSKMLDKIDEHIV